MTSNTIDSASPLYLHPSDGSNTVIVEKLQGASNYRPWKRSIEIALVAKRKLGFVSGAETRDKTDPVKQEAWDTCNNMVISWILTNLSDNIKKSIMFMNSAHSMWKNLEMRFQLSNGARKYQLNKMLYETKQQGKPVNDYFTEMQVLWEELDDLTVHPPLTVINAEVSQYVLFRNQQVEEQKLFQFLNGLDDINGAVRSNLLMKTPLPTVEEACNAVSQEESQRDVLKPVKEEHEGLVMYGSGAGTSSQPEKCSVCGKLGHTAAECWYVKGFPTGYNRKGKGKEGGRGMAANVHNQRGSSHHQSKESKEEKPGTYTITAQQLEQWLKTLPPPSKSGGGETDDELDCNYAGMVTCCQAEVEKTKWILDSGASHHMTGCSKRLTEIRGVVNQPKIDLPNGNVAVVTHKGNAHLNENIELKNVMLVPSFHHNLVSIQKLAKDNNLEVKFKESYCLITCANSGEVKGVGIAEKGLYTLVNEPIRTFAKRIKDMQRIGSKDQNTKANAVTKVEVPDVLQNQRNLSKPMLWHHRLGHTPLERIRNIPQVQVEVEG
ncbi:Retrovirus-related Pol polyprotein from transposon RE2 [Bienertia sinuspersici]